MSNLSNEQLEELLQKRGYGIASQSKGISGGIKGTVRQGSAISKVDGAGSLDNVESTALDESLGAKKLQVNYSGLPEIRITFYRRRLADHSRAISEKALVDCLQYAGLIEGDSQKEIRLTDVTQSEVGSDEEERTEIEIIYPEVDYDNLWKKAKANKAR
jgi:hypothetical protein